MIRRGVGDALGLGLHGGVPDVKESMSRRLGVGVSQSPCPLPLGVEKPLGLPPFGSFPLPATFPEGLPFPFPTSPVLAPLDPFACLPLVIVGSTVVSAGTFPTYT